MTMASLTASLLTRRNDDRRRTRGAFPAHSAHAENALKDHTDHGDHTGHGSIPQGFALIEPQQRNLDQKHPNTAGKNTAGINIVPSGPAQAKPKQAARRKQGADKGQKTGPTSAVKRKSKTLRLDPKCDRRLRHTAARLGTTQQSIMEQGLKSLLDSLSRDTAHVCGQPLGKQTNS